MNKQGLFELGSKHFAARSAWLQPHVTKGKFAEFFPEVIVSFLRWKYGRVVPRYMCEELAQFMSLSYEAQVAELAGIVLAHEYAKEDSVDDGEPPF